jgi:hypothetical protein
MNRAHRRYLDANARRGGARGSIHTRLTSWALDDRKWFEANWDRSHRVRPRLVDEWFTSPGDAPASTGWWSGKSSRDSVFDFPSKFQSLHAPNTCVKPAKKSTARRSCSTPPSRAGIAGATSSWRFSIDRRPPMGARIDQERASAGSSARLSNCRQERNPMIHHCTFEGCPKSVEWPAVFWLPPEGWTWLERWGPGVRDGMYCEPHAKALEALLLSGELHQAQRPPARRPRRARR